MTLEVDGDDDDDDDDDDDLDDDDDDSLRPPPMNMSSIFDRTQPDNFLITD